MFIKSKGIPDWDAEDHLLEITTLEYLPDRFLAYKEKKLTSEVLLKYYYRIASFFFFGALFVVYALFLASPDSKLDLFPLFITAPTMGAVAGALYGGLFLLDSILTKPNIVWGFNLKDGCLLKTINDKSIYYDLEEVKQINIKLIASDSFNRNSFILLRTRFIIDMIEACISLFIPILAASCYCEISLVGLSDKDKLVIAKTKRTNLGREKVLSMKAAASFAKVIQKYPKIKLNLEPL